MFNNYDFNALFNSMFNFNSSFGWFSPRKTVPVTTTTGADVNLGGGLSYNVKTNGLNIHGNKGFEQITIAQNVSGINVDSAIESVTLKGVNFDPSLMVSSQGKLAINSSTGSNLVTLSLAANHNESLSFANAVGSLSLDNTGKGVFNLSELQLNKNQNYVATVNDLIVYGNSGQEKVTIGHDVIGVSVSDMIETVAIDGKSSDYSYVIQGGTVVVSNNATGKDAAFIDVNGASTGTQIQFTDKTLSATWENDSFGFWNYWNVVVTDPTIPATPTTISGGTNLPYFVDFSGANLGSNLANVEANVKTALENIGQYISSKTTFNLQVLTNQAPQTTLAEAIATMVDYSPNQNSDSQITTTFLAESISGTELNEGMADATLYINLANLKNMSFDGKPVAEKYDLTTILTHEILHGMAFTGSFGSTIDEQSPFDALVTLQKNSPVFTGTHAKAANGDLPVSLVSESAGDGSAYYHVTDTKDLMSDSLGAGEVRTISPLDVAMLQDMGLAIVGVPPVQPVQIVA